MFLRSLELEDFRNLRRLSLDCSPDLNLIAGENASGKTSLLEALYFLGRGRSFRGAQVRELIHRDAARFRIVAVMDDRGRRVPVGLERDTRGFTARVAGAPAQTLAELAAYVPVLLLDPGGHALLEEGPVQRRRFMDWGLFHGRDGGFMDAWRRYATALRHRNAALRDGAPDRDVSVWDEQLDRQARRLDEFRRDYCAQLEQALAPLLEGLLGLGRVTVDYRRGWNREQTLLALLRQGREQDRRHGFTRTGPQRADFVVRLSTRPATEVLSRGQQKLLILALLVAQSELYRQARGSPCLLLVDDLPAELDRRHRDRAMDCLAQARVQLFITAIEAEALDRGRWPDSRVFRLAEGCLGPTSTHD